MMELPENIRETIDLVAAVLRKIERDRVDKDSNPCLYVPDRKGVDKNEQN